MMQDKVGQFSLGMVYIRGPKSNTVLTAICNLAVCGWDLCCVMST